MNEKQIIREIMHQKRCTQQQLADGLGYKSQANVIGLLSLSKKGMRTDIFKRITDFLGCEIIIRDTISGQEWIVGEAEEEIPTPRKMTKDEEIAMLREQLARYQGSDYE